MEIKPEQIHITYRLTDAIFVPHDGCLETNRLGLWCLIASVVITSASTHEKLSDLKNLGPTHFIGHFCMESSPFALQDFINGDYAQQTYNAMRTKALEVAQAGQYKNITQAPNVHKF